jgi:hypothetical protein
MAMAIRLGPLLARRIGTGGDGISLEAPAEVPRSGQWVERSPAMLVKVLRQEQPWAVWSESFANETRDGTMMGPFGRNETIQSQITSQAKRCLVARILSRELRLYQPQHANDGRNSSQSRPSILEQTD